MIEVNRYESLADAVAAFTAETKVVLRDAKEHDHFSPKRKTRHSNARSASMRKNYRELP